MLFKKSSIHFFGDFLFWWIHLRRGSTSKGGGGGGVNIIDMMICPL